MDENTSTPFQLTLPPIPSLSSPFLLEIYFSLSVVLAVSFSSYLFSFGYICGTVRLTKQSRKVIYFVAVK